MTARIAASVSGGRTPDVGHARERELADRVEADGQGQETDGERGERPEHLHRGVHAAEEVDGLLEEVGQVPRLATPEQEQAGHQHPQPIQRDQGQDEHETEQQPLVHAYCTPKSTDPTTMITTARVTVM